MSKMKYPQAQFRLPRGRYVRGSFTKKTTTDHKKQPMPENKHHLWVAIAVEKTAPGITDVLNGVLGHTWQSYSNVAGNQAVMAQLQQGFAAPSFSWKISDADTDPMWQNRDGCKNSWIFEMRSYFDSMNTFDGLNRQLDASCFALGDYVDAFISVEINGETDPRVAGIYVNPVVVRWLETGPRITVGADAATLFGDTVGQGYVAPQAGPMPAHLTPPPAAPGAYAPPPPAAPPAPPVPAETTEQWNIRHTGTHAPGYRYDPVANAWAADAGNAAPAAHQMPATGQYPQPSGSYPPAAGQPVTHMPPAGGVPSAYPSSVGNGPVSAPAAPVAAPPPPAAPSVAAPPPTGVGYPNASRSEYGPGNPPPGVVQQNYAGGPPRVG